ncbi:hypothetical protein IWZ01DRAFT_72697 [Phyllosticta capitalensis]
MSPHQRHRSSLSLSTPFHPFQSTDCVSICFVHGLGGHREETWTWMGDDSSDESKKSKKNKDHHVFWPEELLPETFGDLRIITWGYDSNLKGLASGKIQSSLYDFGTGLLQDLVDERDEDAMYRPLFLVGHSLGGLVIQEALVQSSMSRDDQMKSLFHCTRNVIFMGTPHRGSETMDLGQTLIWATKACLKNPNDQFLNTLKPNSQILSNACQSFGNIAHQFGPICFFEELATCIAGFQQVIVEKQSAVLYGFRSVGIPASHTQMCRFKDKSDVGYTRFRGELKKKVRDLRKDLKKREEEATGRGLERNEEGQSLLTYEPAEVPLSSPEDAWGVYS